MNDSSAATTPTSFSAEVKISRNSSDRHLRDALLTHSSTAQRQRIISFLGAKLRNYKPRLETWHFSQDKPNYWSKTKYLNVNVCWLLYCGVEICEVITWQQFKCFCSCPLLLPHLNCYRRETSLDGVVPLTISSLDGKWLRGKKKYHSVCAAEGFTRQIHFILQELL